MYNGIGLSTVRGSGTNGYVQKNFAHVRKRPKQNETYKTEEEIAHLERQLNRKPNEEILEHERKRLVESKCMELQIELEDKGYGSKDVLFWSQFSACKLAP
jgi:serine/arginine repetitive matrix protein 2